MCKKLLNELRDCNQEIDRELSDGEKIAILWEACLLNRKALTKLILAGLEFPDLTPERRVAFKQFLEDTKEGIQTLPLGKKDDE